MPKICVKWGGKKFDVEASTDFEPLVLKSQLFELTGVVPDRQRVLIKGKQLRDDGWDGITLQDGMTIMMMGSVAEVAEVRAKADEKTAETPQAEIEEKLILPVGLKNLGNTCYMNACLQAYKVIPELMTALKNYSVVENEANSRSHLLVSTSKKFYDDLERLEKTNHYSVDTAGKQFIPFFLLNVLHGTFPQFATRDPHGHFQQQDANECFSEVLQLLTSQTDVPVGGASRLAGVSEEDLSTKQAAPRVVRTSRIFQTEFDYTLKNLETEEEPAEKGHESHMQLSCFLGQDVKYIQSGIKNRLTEEIEKNSSFLGRDAKYQKKSLISRLPEYLCIQMVRFFFKKKDQINAKILKDVKFPINLDLYEACTPELQEKLNPMRDLYKAHDDKVVEKLRQSKLNDTLNGSDKNGKNAATANNSSADSKFWSNSFVTDPGSNNSGFYELKAIITHKGRSSNSGHYVAWVRTSANQWAMCDDDEVHPITEEEVLKLSGGGDWHCAYVLVYGPRPLPKNDDEVVEKSAENLEVSAAVAAQGEDAASKMEVN